MGSYAVFTINDYEISWMKSYVDPTVMSLFSEYDRKESIEHDEEDESYEYKKVVYQSSIKIIKKRLNILGFNLKTLEEAFKKSKCYRLDNFDEDELKNKKDSYSRFLQRFTFDKYLSALKEIYDNKIDFFGNGNSFNFEKFEKIEKIKKAKPYVKYILEEVEYPDERVDIDYRFYFRGFLEKLDENLNIFVDVSDLIDSGYYDIEDKIAEQCLNKNDKTIIFTEGKYDTSVIRESLKLLYPEYSNYYSFLDIELSNLELGANRVITYLKSFISAGIINKVIVLFDNDAEGLFCKQEVLKLKNIPNNFSIKTYPNIDIAKKYPTICPTGVEELDINDCGCSIELYLCDEVLKENNTLIPIQWSSFNEHVKKYQGSFSSKNKGSIQKKYSEILKKCKANSLEISKYNFDNMKTLLEDIFMTFDDNIL